MNHSNILLPELRDIIIQYTLPSIDDVKENKNKIFIIFENIHFYLLYDVTVNISFMLSTETELINCKLI